MFFVFSLTQTYCDLKKLKGLWTSVTSSDLNAVWRSFKMPLIYGTETYILFSSTDSSEPLKADPVFTIVSIQSG